MNIRNIISGHRTLLITGIILGLLGAVAALAQPLFIGILIGAVPAGDPISAPIIIIVVLFALDAALSAASAYLIGRAGENIVFDTRIMLVGRLLRSRLPIFQRYETGDIFTRMVGDTTLACMVVTQALAQLASSAFMVFGGIILMIVIDWRLLLAAITCLGLASIVSLIIARQVRIVSLANREDTSAFGSGLQRILGALITVKASRAEGRETQQMADLAGAARRSGIRVTALGALLQPAMNVGTQLSFAVVIAWGMSRVAMGELPAASLTAFVMYLFYLVSPLVMLFLSIGQIQQGRAAIQRVAEIADIPQEEASGVVEVVEQDTQSDNSQYAVSFEKVTFSYEENSPTLQDVSFSIPTCGLTAVVGPSGAGKTTVFQLIERLYSPEHGVIRVGGDDIAQITLGQLRGRIGYVEQDSPLLRGTIRENLIYANPDADDAEISRVLGLVRMREHIDSLPDGIDSELGERGTGLSGGQRQRLAIARTLLQRPEVILLDEATAHLDSDTEAALRQAISGIADECAILTIAHRISTVAQADRIIVLESGGVRTVGTHAELVANDEVYRRLAEQQLQVEVSTEANGR